MNLITKLIFATFLIAFTSHVNFAQIKELQKDTMTIKKYISVREYSTTSFPVARKLFGPAYGASLYARHFNDTTHYYVHFFIEHLASKRKWKTFKFKSCDTIIFVQENNTMLFTNLDTTNSFSTMSEKYNYQSPTQVPTLHNMPAGPNMYYNAPAVMDFDTSFEISKEQLDELMKNEIEGIKVRTSFRKLKSRANGKKFSEKTNELYGLVSAELKP